MSSVQTGSGTAKPRQCIWTGRTALFFGSRPWAKPRNSPLSPRQEVFRHIFWKNPQDSTRKERSQGPSASERLTWTWQIWSICNPGRILRPADRKRRHTTASSSLSSLACLSLFLWAFSLPGRSFSFRLCCFSALTDSFLPYPQGSRGMRKGMLTRFRQEADHEPKNAGNTV